MYIFTVVKNFNSITKLIRSTLMDVTNNNTRCKNTIVWMNRRHCATSGSSQLIKFNGFNSIINTTAYFLRNFIGMNSRQTYRKLLDTSKYLIKGYILVRTTTFKNTHNICFMWSD